MVRKKGANRHSEETKNLMVSLINDYKLFNATDAEMMRLIGQKLGKPISYGLFAELKKKAAEKNIISNEWLSNYVKGPIIEHYRTRIRELEYVQRTLLEEFTAEASKQERKNKFLINALAKTISENTTRLAEMGMSPPVIAKLYSMIPREILEGNMDPIHLEKYLKDFDGKTPDVTKEDDDTIKAIHDDDRKDNVDNKENDVRPNGAAETTDGSNSTIDPLNRETALPPAIDKKDDNRSSGGSPSETATAQGDQPIF